MVALISEIDDPAEWCICVRSLSDGWLHIRNDKRPFDSLRALPASTGLLTESAIAHFQPELETRNLKFHIPLSNCDEAVLNMCCLAIFQMKPQGVHGGAPNFGSSSLESRFRCRPGR